MLPVCTRKQICCILCPVDQERDFSRFCGAKKRTTPLATKSCCMSIIITCYFTTMYYVCFILIGQTCVLSVIFLSRILFTLSSGVIILTSFATFKIANILLVEHKKSPHSLLDGENQIFFLSFTLLQ